VLEIGRYLLDVILLECDRNERGSYFHLFLDCEGVYCLLCDNSMPGPCWKRLCCDQRCWIPCAFPRGYASGWDLGYIFDLKLYCSTF
jgi:hypothetical protein